MTNYSDFCLQLLHPLKADYQLEVRVLSYENPTHSRSDGHCCDDIFCHSDCDTHLIFCLQPPGYSDDIEEDCPLGELTAGQVGGDSITSFGDSVGDLPNPFTVQVQGNWMV